MILKLNVVDNLQRSSYMFYHVKDCVLLDDKGFNILDIESHPYRSSILTKLTDISDQVYERFCQELEDIQQQSCASTVMMFLSGRELTPMHKARYSYFMDNFLVTPSPKHSMEWLCNKDAFFYYNFPYFVAIIYHLTGKVIVSVDQLVVDPV